jgi:hypothetical protein
MDKLFKHRSAPQSEFWYPIPISDGDGEPRSNVFAQFLSCRTQRAWLVGGGRLLPRGPYSRLQNFIPLIDQGGKIVGELELLISESYSRSNSPRTVQLNQLLELVVMSKGVGSIYKNLTRLLDLDTRQKEMMRKRHEYYNVMWIEWQDRVAYRRGVGKVSKSDWEAQDTEWIDLTLG